MDYIETIKTETQDLLKKIIDKFEIEVEQDEDVYHVVIKAEEEAPTVIGRHGETIRAIQKLLEVILYKKTNEPMNILVNVNDYREKQKERLEDIASQMAKKTLDLKSATHLRRFSSYERKLVHEYITQNYPELTTYSVGEGRDRELVIDVKSQSESTDNQ